MPKSTISNILLYGIMAANVCSALMFSSRAFSAVDDWPDFDRPGILFSPSTLPVGSWSIELGIFDFSKTNQGDNKEVNIELHTMLRYGLIENWELQIEFTPYNWRQVRGYDSTSRQSGYGDARIGSRFDSSEYLSDWFLADAVAIQAGIQLKTGHSDFTESSHTLDLGMVVSWDLGKNGKSIDIMVQRFFANDDNSWFFASSFGIPVNESLSTFLEAGFWRGDADGGLLGAGLIWRPSIAMQLDSYALFRMSGDVPDTQVGIGFSWMFF